MSSLLFKGRDQETSVYFQAYRNSGQLTAGSFIAWDSVYLHSHPTAYATLTGIYTIPVNGSYYMYFNSKFTNTYALSNGIAYQMDISVGGSGVVRGYQNPYGLTLTPAKQGVINCYMSSIVGLTAGDQLSWRVNFPCTLATRVNMVMLFKTGSI